MEEKKDKKETENIETAKNSKKDTEKDAEKKMLKKIPKLMKR